jgi:hypothetical protein
VKKVIITLLCFCMVSVFAPAQVEPKGEPEFMQIPPNIPPPPEMG